MTEGADGGSSSGNLEFINGLNARMLTLSAALSGGGIFLLTDWTLGIAVRAAVVIGLCSFVCSLMGLEASTRRHSPEALLKVKWRWFRVSALGLLAALALTLFGILYR